MEVSQAITYITKAQARLREQAGKVELGNRYYNNEDDIEKTGAAAIDAVNGYLKEIGQNPLRSADNRISNNWHEILTVQKNAYLFTYPPVFTVGEDEELSQQVNELLGDSFAKTMSRLGTFATNAGTAWLQYWVSEDGTFHTAALEADKGVAFTEPTDIEQTIIVFVREYLLPDENGDEIPHYEVWDKDEVVFINGKTLEEESVKMNGREVTRLLNPFGEVPFIEFPNNERKSSDLQKYKRLIDAYDKVVSGFINDLDDLQEIIFVLKDFRGDAENTISVPVRDEKGELQYDMDGDVLTKEVQKPVNLLQQIKAQKYLTVDESGGVDKITLEIPTEARNVALTLLQKQIYIAGMGVDPNPERTGQATGAYVDHLYHLLELKAGLMETEFRSSLNKLIRAVLKHLNREDKKVKITQSWTRNKPKDANETVNRLNATPREVMSDYTKRRLHPDIDDPDLEDTLVKQEQEELAKSMMDSLQQSEEAEV